MINIKQPAQKKNEIINKKEYTNLLNDIKSILQKGLYKAYKAVDNLKVQTYWQVGERILREEVRIGRAGYGEEIVKKLAVDLGVHERTLYRILRFYKTYPILTTVLSELSWSHYLTLIDIADDEIRKFYEIQCINERWSVRQLKVKIENKRYYSANKEKIAVKRPLQLPSPEDIFKEAYEWGFLDLEKDHSEKQLEKAILNNVEKVLLEFGKGFAFMGSQQKVQISGQYHKIDLLFFNKPLRCSVIIELKTEKFKADFVGQINKYLTYFKEKKLEWERDPIGLIICKEKDYEEVHYALGKLKEDIFVSEYKTQLPSEEEIKQKLKGIK